MSNWQDTELRKVLHVKHGFAFKGEYFSNTGNKILITPGNFFEEGGFKYTPGKEKYYTAEYPKEYLCKKGDLVIAMTEQAAGLLGSTALVPVDDIFLHNQRIGLLTFNECNYDKLFLYYLFRTKSVREQIALSSSGSKVKHTSPERIYDVKVKIPSFPTQKEIGRILFNLDAKIELNNRINAELEQMAKTLYDYWFVQFDFPVYNPDGTLSKAEGYKSSGGKMVWSPELKREVPEGWEVKRIDEIISVKDGTHDSPKPKSFGYNLITSKNLKIEGLDFESANFISEEDYIAINKRSKVDTGDILFSMIGNIGTVYKIEEKEINFAVKNVALYKSSEKMEYRNFIYMFLKSDDMKKYMANTISGSIQKFIGLGDLRKMPIFINDSFIAKFEETTKSIFEKQNQVKIENQHLSSLRDWLLPMLMNGQVKVWETKAYMVGDERLGMVAEP